MARESAAALGDRCHGIRPGDPDAKSEARGAGGRGGGVVALGPTSERVTGQGASTPPILLVLNNSPPPPTATTYAEILPRRGHQQLRHRPASPRSPVRHARQLPARLLAETTLSAAQATMFTSLRRGGGRLAAMRPNASAERPARDHLHGRDDHQRLPSEISPVGPRRRPATRRRCRSRGRRPTTRWPAAPPWSAGCSATTTARPPFRRCTASTTPPPGRSTWPERRVTCARAIRPTPANRMASRRCGPTISSSAMIDKARVSIPHADVQMRLLRPGDRVAARAAARRCRACGTSRAPAAR